MSIKSKLFVLGAYICISFFAHSALTFADVYVVSFYFDKQASKLEFDPSSTQTVSIDTTKQLSTDVRYQMFPNGAYEAVFVSVNGNEIDRKRFDVTSGIFSVDFPYYSIAKTLNIYKVNSSDILLSLDLSKFTTCFMNGICEYEKGENIRTCISDCASDTVQFSDETRKLLAQNNDVLKDPKTGEILLRGPEAVTATDSPASTQAEGGNIAVLVVLVAFFVVIGIFVVVILKIRKRNRRYGL